MIKPFILLSASILLGCGPSNPPPQRPLFDKTTVQMEEAVPQTVQWRKPSTDAIKESIDKNRYMLVLFSQDWCRYCRQLKKTMDTPQVAEFINKNFVPVEIDGAEDDLVKEVTGQTSVSYPTVVFMSPEKEIVAVIEGAGAAEPGDVLKGLMKVLEMKQTKQHAVPEVQKNQQADAR